jgi:pimeloyl-ACP methyl ester carboxylesterase
MKDIRTELKAVTVSGRAVRCRTLLPGKSLAHRSTDELPLLLLHGIGCSADMWVPTLECLRQHGTDRHVVAPDMPGYGHSHGPPEALGIDDLADWSVRLLDRMEVMCAHVVGHSMGCQIGLALARRHPERVGALVLVGPTTGGRLVSAHRYLLGLLLDGLCEPLAYNRLLARTYWQMGVRRYLATVQKMLADDPLATAAELRTPCLIVRGERDAIVSDAVVRDLAAVLPHGILSAVPGAPHAVQFASPGEFTRRMLSFLEDAEGASRSVTQPLASESGTAMRS